MWASVTGSEEIALRLMWQVSIALALLSFLVLGVLIACRLFSAHRQANAARRRAELEKRFYAALYAPLTPDATAPIRLDKADAAILCHIALDILRSVRGEDSVRILSLLKAWGAWPHLVRMLNDGRRGVRIQALTLLAYDSGSDDVLLRYTQEKDPYISLAALRGLAAHHGTAHIGIVIHALSHTEGANTLMLADILRLFGDDAAKPLAQLTAGDAHRSVRLAAVMALGMIRTLEGVDTLLPLLNDQDAEIRARAAESLGRMGDIRAASDLRFALSDANAPVRLHAAQALGVLGDTTALERLAAMLNDSDWWVSFRAAEAIAQLGDKGKSLLRAIAAREDNAGKMAASVLAEKAGT